MLVLHDDKLGVSAHISRYIPAEEMRANVASNQNITRTARLNQGPVLDSPYCDILIRIVPNETTAAGMNNRSLGCMKEALKVSG
jgi:hypothetical protein